MKRLLSGLRRLILRPFEMFKDLKLQCAQCGGTFRFEWGEQQFFKSRGLTPPKRCSGCRSSGRSRRDRRPDGFSDGRPREDRPRFEDRGRQDVNGSRGEAPRSDRDDDRGHSRYIDDSPFYGEGGGGRGRDRDRDRDRGDRDRGRRRRR